MPAALDVDWDAAEKLAMSGMPLREVSQRLSVPFEALRKRSQRYSWIIPKQPTRPDNVEARARMTKAAETAQRVKECQDSGIESIRLQHPLSVARYVSQKVSHALEMDTLPDIQSWDRLDVADKIIRRAVGLDAKAQLNVNIGVFAPESMWSAPESDKSALDQSSSPPTFEAITEVVSDGPDDE